MNRAAGLPVRSMRWALTWYGESSSMRSAQTSFGSPIDTQTSVCTKSTPCTPAVGSSVTVTRAPVPAATARAASTTSAAGCSDAGATIRTSIPIRAPRTSSELPMLNRASPT